MMPAIIVCATFFTYVAVAVLFTKHPQLIHGRRKTRLLAPHISHRGGAAERLENTLAAFQHAVKNCRTDMLELDCHLTKDGKVVVVHDANLLRLTGVDVSVGELNYSDLPPLRDRLSVSFSPADCADVRSLETENDKQAHAELRRICLLEDVFRRFPETAINLDVKVNDDRLIERVASLIRQYNRESITAWGNLNSVVCEKCYRIAPEIPLIFSVRRVVQTLALFYLGLLPFFKLKEQFFEVPAVSLMLATFDRQKRERSLRSEADSNADDDAQSQTPHFEITWKFRLLTKMINSLLMRRSLIEHLRKRGIATFCWVLNDEAAFEHAFRNVGVDGVMTDRPTALRRYLNEHPELLARISKCE